MPDTLTDVTTIEPLDHRRAVEFGRTEYRRLADLVGSLGPDDWGRPTDCTGWTVRDLAGHLLGAMRAAASIREQLSQLREASRHDGDLVDGLTAAQIRRTADLTTAELVAEMAATVDAAADGRRRTPALLRRGVRARVTMGDLDERWNLGYLVGPILTRDSWLHRIDLSRAVDRPVALDADHDGAIIADVVAEWCRRHGEPVELRLAGPAGGAFVQGHDGPVLETDPVELARMLSGRAEPIHPLFTTVVPF